MAISLNADQGIGLSEKLDTLAQSFLVDQPRYITKLGLFFSQKEGVLPIEVSLRKIENDSPSANIVPNSHVVLDIDNITTSANSLIETTITFPLPVYLDSGEYCFTLSSDTKNNKVYTAALGGQDIATSAIISKQPYTGVMFMSSNGREWSVDQTRDIKFKLYCAKFTSTVASVDFKLKNDGLDQTNITYLDKDQFKTFNASDVIRVFHENSGFTEGKLVKFNGLAGGLDYIANANNVVKVNGIPFEKLENVVFTVHNVSSTGYTVTVDIDSATKANVTAGTFPYSGAAVTTMVPYSTLVSGISEIVPLKTTSSHKVRTTDETLTVSDYVPIEFGSISFTDTQLLVDEINNAASMSDSESFYYKVELSTNDEFVSPVINIPFSSALFISPQINDPSLADNLTIDNILIANASTSISFTFSNTTGFVNIANASIQSNVRAMQKGSYVTISNTLNANNTGTFRVTNIADDGSYFEIPTAKTENAGNAISILYRPMYISDEAAFGTSSKAKYITRKITLASPSTAFNMRMTVSKPAGSDIEVYYKTQNNNEVATFESKEYTKLDMGEIQTTLTNQFVEIESTVDGLNEFDAFIIKIVLKSSSMATYPTVSDFRFIALQ